MKAGPENKRSEAEPSDVDESELETFESENSSPEGFEPDEVGEESETGTANEIESHIAEIQRLADERLDQLLRCRAELDNALKRAAREKADLSRYASEKLIVKMLPVLDSFDQAAKHDQGLEKISQQLLDVLQSEGLLPIPAVGEKFDPYTHEALMMVQSDEHEEGTVVEEVLRGYSLNSKVIRFSKVVVSKK